MQTQTSMKIAAVKEDGALAYTESANSTQANIDLHKIALLVKELAQVRQEARRQSNENAVQAAEVQRLQMLLTQIRSANSNDDNNNSKSSKKTNNSIDDRSCDDNNNELNKEMQIKSKEGNNNNNNNNNNSSCKSNKESYELPKLKELLKWKNRYRHMRHKYQHIKSQRTHELHKIQNMVSQLTINDTQATPLRAQYLCASNTEAQNKTCKLHEEYEHSHISSHQTMNNKEKIIKTHSVLDAVANQWGNNNTKRVSNKFCTYTNVLGKHVEKDDNEHCKQDADLVESCSKANTFACECKSEYFDDNNDLTEITAEMKVPETVNTSIFTNTPNKGSLDNNNDSSNNKNLSDSKNESYHKSMCENGNLQQRQAWFDNLLARAEEEEEIRHQHCYQEPHSHLAIKNVTRSHPYNIELSVICNDESKSHEKQDNKCNFYSAAAHHNVYTSDDTQKKTFNGISNVRLTEATENNNNINAMSLTEGTEEMLNKSVAAKQAELRSKVYAEFDRHDKLLHEINRLQHTASIYAWRKLSVTSLKSSENNNSSDNRK